MNLDEVIRKRRTIRRFCSKVVEKEKIIKIIDNARWAPSACNEQLWHFIIVQDSNKKRELCEKAGSSNLLKDTPIVIACYYYIDTKLRFVPGIESVSAAIQNMLLTADSLGLGAAWISSVGKREVVDKLLNVPKNYYLASFVLLGYPNTIPSAPPRKEMEEILHFEIFRDNILKIKSTHNPSKWTIGDIITYQRFVSRKTNLGEELDVANEREKILLREKLKTLNEPILDLFSYDGSLLDCFKKNVLSLELSKETAEYIPNNNIITFDSNNLRFPINDLSFSSASLLFKLERLPPEYWPYLFSEAYRILKYKGKFIVVFRNMASLYGLFYKLLLWIIGDNIRKTGIYAFWGPYRPIANINNVTNLLEKSGFKIIELKKYHFVPQVFEDYSQMFLKYLSSGGATYGKSDKNKFLVKFVRFICKIGRLPYGGSITMLIAESE